MSLRPDELEFLVRYRLPRPISRAYETVCLSQSAEEITHRSRWCAQVALRYCGLLKQACRLALNAQLPINPPSERDLRRGSAPATEGADRLPARMGSPAAALLAKLDVAEFPPLWQLLDPQRDPFLLSHRLPLREALSALLPLVHLRLATYSDRRLNVLLGPRMEYPVPLDDRIILEHILPADTPLLINPDNGDFISLSPLLIWRKLHKGSFGRLLLLSRVDGTLGHYVEEGVPGCPGANDTLRGRPRTGRLPLDVGTLAALASPPARFRDGEQLAGHHQVHGLIWRGGTSDIFAAERLPLHDPVVLKTFEYDAALIDENFWRFVKEERFSEQIVHPSVVVARRLPRGPWGLVHEQRMARRGALSDLLLVQGVLRADRALAILERLLDALQAVHVKGVIHNDVKPENILFDEDGSLLLIDFGIATDAIGAADSLRPGALVGTPGYIAPELHHGGRPSARSDLYAAGVVLRQMLTGEEPPVAPAGSMPAGAEGAPEAGQTSADAAGPTSSPSRIPAPLEPLLGRLIAVESSERFPSAADAREAFAAVRGALKLERAITLDIEGTLIPSYRERTPRPGLAEFLNLCLERADRLFVYTMLSREEAREVFAELASRGEIPGAFCDRYEYVDWPHGAEGSRKDLRRCRVPLEQNLIVDDMESWIAEDQADRWIKIGDCSQVHGVDRELERVREEIEKRLREMG